MCGVNATNSKVRVLTMRCTREHSRIAPGMFTEETNNNEQ
jgi:hypothetical protein